MQHIARLLEIPGQSGPPSPAFVGSGIYTNRTTGRGNLRNERPLFNTSARGPGFAAPRRENSPHNKDSPNAISNLKPRLKRDSLTGNGSGKKETRSRDSSASSSRGRSRESSPRMPRPRSEEIPLELIKKLRILLWIWRQKFPFYHGRKPLRTPVVVVAV